MKFARVTLQVENKTTKKIPTQIEIKSTILSVLKEKHFDINSEVGLKIVGESEIKKLNYTFRGKDSTTDVLSFPIFDKPPKISETLILLGDIVICYNIMARNAEEFGLKENEEFLKLISHSTLHLLGFHHKDD